LWQSKTNQKKKDGGGFAQRKVFGKKARSTLDCANPNSLRRFEIVVPFFGSFFRPQNNSFSFLQLSIAFMVIDSFSGGARGKKGTNDVKKPKWPDGSESEGKSPPLQEVVCD
jgi:hypothetical protein